MFAEFLALLFIIPNSSVKAQNAQSAMVRNAQVFQVNRFIHNVEKWPNIL